MLTWLAEAEEGLAEVKGQESSDPEALQGQLNRIKSMSSDALAQQAQLEELKRSGGELTSCLTALSADEKQVKET